MNVREYYKLYYLKNKEKIIERSKEYSKMYYQVNKDSIRQKQKMYYSKIQNISYNDEDININKEKVIITFN